MTEVIQTNESVNIQEAHRSFADNYKGPTPIRSLDDIIREHHTAFKDRHPNFKTQVRSSKRNEDYQAKYNGVALDIEVPNPESHTYEKDFIYKYDKNGRLIFSGGGDDFSGYKEIEYDDNGNITLIRNCIIYVPQHDPIKTYYDHRIYYLNGKVSMITTQRFGDVPDDDNSKNWRDHRPAIGKLVVSTFDHKESNPPES